MDTLINIIVNGYNQTIRQNTSLEGKHKVISIYHEQADNQLKSLVTEYCSNIHNTTYGKRLEQEIQDFSAVERFIYTAKSTLDKATHLDVKNLTTPQTEDNKFLKLL